jgi:hypothetical protein
VIKGTKKNGWMFWRIKAGKEARKSTIEKSKLITLLVVINRNV